MTSITTIQYVKTDCLICFLVILSASCIAINTVDGSDRVLSIRVGGLGFGFNETQASCKCSVLNPLKLAQVSVEWCCLMNEMSSQ